MVSVNYTLPGRAPAVLNKEDSILACPSRSGMDIQIFRKTENKYVQTQVLKKHDMIVNTLVLDKNILLSAGWDSRVGIWVMLLI